MATSTRNDSGLNSCNIESTSLLQVNAISVKFPSFSTDAPGLMFAHVEAQFHAPKNTIEETKYFTVVGAVEQRVLNVVNDIVTSPPENTPYQKLKATVISRLTDTDNIQIKKKMLSRVNLGDKKPSQLLRENLEKRKSREFINYC
ncbi:reverse transcriptase domain-containing protein [Nephila pilipes]|uniref:Reverse transcriptase domain-containing protein n=1 Tax=Nephila pilipes TaxID=299642 RepID=A0A8X6UH22_NEPPI|nr:reverse transcriptase domain-containing protein [Nephila pilipes]